MRVIKAMGKALLVMMCIIGASELIAYIIKVAQIDPMAALGFILLVGGSAAATIGFYIIDNDK